MNIFIGKQHLKIIRKKNLLQRWALRTSVVFVALKISRSITLQLLINSGLSGSNPKPVLP